MSLQTSSFRSLWRVLCVIVCASMLLNTFPPAAAGLVSSGAVSAVNRSTGRTLRADDAPHDAEIIPLAAALRRAAVPYSQASVPIAYGQTVAGTIVTPGQVVSYTFSVAAGDVVLVRLSADACRLVPSIGLYAPDGTLLASGWDYCHTEITRTLSAGGSYALAVADRGGAQTGGYNLHLQRLNGPESATPLRYGQTLTGTITLTAQWRAYTFTAGPGDVILAGASADGCCLVQSLRLYASDGRLLGSAGSYYRAEITHSLSAGSYTLLVGDKDGTQTGSYSLHLQRLNGPGEATALRYGQTLIGTIALAAQMDAYTFTASAGDAILVRMAAGMRLDPGIRLYASDGRLLASGWDYGHTEITQTLSAAGNYTLLVGDRNGARTGSYSLHLQRLNGPGNATPLRYGQALTDTIVYTAQLGAYTFAANAGDTILAGMSARGILVPEIRLYASDGSLLGSALDSRDAGLWAVHHIEITKTLAARGNYMLLIGDRGSAWTGSYDVFLSRPTRMQLAPGAAHTDSLASGYDLDWYSVRVEAGDLLTVRVTKDVRWYGSLYFRYGAWPTESDYDARSYETQGNQAVSIPVTRAGTYYIIMCGAIRDPGYGGYTISAQTRTSGWPVLRFGVPEEVVLTLDGPTWYQAQVPSGTANLFLTLQRYDGWNQALKVYSGTQEVTSTSGFDDQILQWPSPPPGTYSVAVSGSGRARLTAYTALPQLPLGRWVVGSIYRPWGSAWYQIRVPAGQASLYLRVETLGLWSQLHVYRDAFGSTPTWSASGYSMTLQIPSPEPGTYYVQLTDSALVEGSDQTRDHIIKADGVPIAPPPCSGPVVAGISPTSGGTAGPVTITADGQCLDPGSAVRLKRGGYGDVCALTVSGADDGRTLAATFDLSRTVPGDWNVVITDPSARSVTAPISFTVASGGEARLQVEIIGREQIRIGRESAYIIQVENVGTCDSGLAFVFLSLPAGATFRQVKLGGTVVWDHLADAGSPVALAIPPLFPGEELLLEATLLVAAGMARAEESSGTSLVPPALPLVATVILVQELEVFAQSFFKHKWDEYVQEPGDPAYYIDMGAAFENAFEEWASLPAQEGAAFDSFWTFIFDSMGRWLKSRGKVAAAKALGVLSFAIISLPDWVEAIKENIEKNPNTRAGGEASKSLWPVTSVSPEDKYGPSGYDPPGTPAGALRRWVAADRPLGYRVDFWNKEDAPAATVDVVITDVLSANLDWSSFRFTEFGFLDWRVQLEPTQSFNVDVPDVAIDLSRYYTGQTTVTMLVNVSGSLDPTSGMVRWEFHALDPATREPPENPYAGFLPPITASGWEIGWVAYNAAAKLALASGATITNQAWVKFDVDRFKPAPAQGPYINTLDALLPSSRVQSPTGRQQCAEFAVIWAGSDGGGGSGLRSYDVYVDDLGDAAGARLWQGGTAETVATFAGTAGHRYGFYTRARDNVGNVEAAPEPLRYDIEVTAGGNCLRLPAILKGGP